MSQNLQIFLEVELDGCLDRGADEAASPATSFAMSYRGDLASHVERRRRG